MTEKKYKTNRNALKKEKYTSRALTLYKRSNLKCIGACIIHKKATDFLQFPKITKGDEKCSISIWKEIRTDT